MTKGCESQHETQDTTMATIYRQFPVKASAARTWELLRDPAGILDFLPLLESVKVEGDRRVCTTVDGAELEELILGIDDEHRRIAYTIQENPFGIEQHNASMQVVEDDDGVEILWITDVKPDPLAETLASVIDDQVKALSDDLV